METVWQKAKSALKEHTPAHVYKMWIEPVQFLKLTGENIVLSCPNNFLKKRVLENFGTIIHNEICRVGGDNLNFLLEVSRGNGKALKHADQSPEAGGQQMLLPKLGSRPKNGRMLRKDFTFDRFVVGKNCDFAYTAALSLASQKKPSQSALFLLSQTGMGKSHLAQAAGHFILSSFPNERVFYITAEDFTNEMVGAYRNNCIDDFKHRYRTSCDVLLLDDIHLLSGRTRTQAELALTLDYLYESGKKIIFSSCMPLKEIPKMSEHLKSRLSQSLISEIEPPDFSTRVRILQKKAKEKACAIPSGVIEFMAGELTENVRTLESGLIGVLTKSCLLGVPVDLPLAASVVRNIVTSQKNITIEGIKKSVCDQFGISIKDIESISRKQEFVRPRQIAIFLCRRHTDQPIQAIGKSFNRYHATVIHSINSVEKELKLKGEMYKIIEIIEKKLNLK
jgi:chromosomal replication initiator protein